MRWATCRLRARATTSRLMTPKMIERGVYESTSDSARVEVRGSRRSMMTTAAKSGRHVVGARYKRGATAAAARSCCATIEGADAVRTGAAHATARTHARSVPSEVTIRTKRACAHHQGGLFVGCSIDGRSKVGERQTSGGSRRRVAQTQARADAGSLPRLRAVCIVFAGVAHRRGRSLTGWLLLDGVRS